MRNLPSTGPSARRVLEEKAWAVALASFDPLTGLHNRRLFNELAASHLEIARRSHSPYMDLDRFKSINDTRGHHVGNLLLQTVAERLKNGLRSANIVGRMGGDEFAVLLTELDSTESVDAIATELLYQLSQPYEELEGHGVRTSPSMGIDWVADASCPLRMPTTWHQQPSLR